MRPVTSWKGRVEISCPAAATPMMTLVPQPLWQASRAALCNQDTISDRQYDLNLIQAKPDCYHNITQMYLDIAKNIIVLKDTESEF